MSPAIDPLPSKFLKPPSSQVPLVLLPVRLETRIEKNAAGAMELWLRVYPDNLHVNSFEPALSVEEQTARTGYLALPAADVPTRKAAFAALARRFGPERAAWLTSADAPAANGKPVPAKAAFTNVLPERWIVLGYQGRGAGEVLTIGPAIADTLAVGPIVGPDAKVISDDTKWVTDFETATKAGMAFRIPLTSQVSFKRIVVLGLKTGVTPQESSARLADLFEAHHYTDGLELLANNTPTNNTEAVASGLATKDTDFTALFALEQEQALCPARPTAEGDRLARALNIDPKTFAHVAGASGSQDEQANAMNRVLWPATWGYYLSQMVSGTMTNPDVLIPAAYDHFVQHVRARGHFPTLRIGNQPYGILPVCWSAQWKPLEARPIDVPLHELLTQLRAMWQRYTGGVPRIPKALDPEAELVELLGMVPSTASTAARNVIGPEYSFMFWNYLKENLQPTWWSNLQAQVQQDSSNLASAMANTRLAQATYTEWHRELSDVLVAPAPLDGLTAPKFVSDLAALATWESFRDAVYKVPGTPTPMLFLLLRHAALRFYVDTALDLLSAAKTIQPSERLDAEMVAFKGTTTPRPGAWDILLQPYKESETVGAYLDGVRVGADLPVFAEYWKDFTQLQKFSATELDAATKEVFDLSSYRLDAWMTSFAHLRLDQTRADPNANGGIVLGAYGWVEDVGLWPDTPASSGFVHAPSLNQSTTAAILRSGYLSHQGGASRPFEIDLSSARVRLALHLLDGIREGQSLGALLGYRLERTLQDLAPADEDLFLLINALRASFPMDGGAASQLDVVDGLALFRKATDIPAFAKATASAPPLHGTLQVALQSALEMLQDALDSVADLALSESVHQLIRGNTVRAGATLDSIARGDAPPLDIDFIKTPRSGTALTYRLMTFAIGNGAPGWMITPRAQAEPRLNAWAAALLGDPAKVRVRARFVGGDGKSLLAVEIGLNQLELAAIDLISLPETEGISGEIADRILRVVEKARPASVPANATVEIVADRDPAWPAATIALAEWLGLLNAVTRLTGASRAIEPADLVAQGAAAGTVDLQDLKTRADNALTAMQAALTSLKGGSDTHEDALMSALAFGVAGAIPGSNPASWPKQVEAALAELNARNNALTTLAKTFNRGTAPPEAQQDYDVARLKAIFGASFVVLPTLDASTAASWPQLWTNSSTLQGGDPLASLRWLQRASRVRAGAGVMDKALMFAEALAGHPLPELEVAQLPVNAADRWVALNGDAPANSTLSLVAFTPMAATAGAAIAGLMVDEWLEVWPSKDQVTGVSFQYSDPIARAPQAILVAVPPDDAPLWTLEAVEGSVLEALDLAKLRGVDPDVLFGDAPPQTLATSANVASFQSMSNPQAFVVDSQAGAPNVSVFVLDITGVLWLNYGPLNDPPLTQTQVDAGVSSLQVLSDNVVVVLKTDGTLWIERGPFGPSTARQQVDSNVTLMPTLPPVIPVQPPPQFKVPNLVGSTQAQLNLQLEKLNRTLTGPTWTIGYYVPVPPINPHQPSRVESQDPPADSPVPQPQKIMLRMADFSDR